MQIQTAKANAPEPVPIVVENVYLEATPTVVAQVEVLLVEWNKEQEDKEIAIQKAKIRVSTKPVGASKFASGYCTDYVARIKPIPWRGDAKEWIVNSKAYGAVVDKIPTVGAILVTSESIWGHVAYIEAVTETTFTFSEWNYSGRYVKTTRTMALTDSRIKGIIHF